MLHVVHYPFLSSELGRTKGCSRWIFLEKWTYVIIVINLWKLQGARGFHKTVHALDTCIRTKILINKIQWNSSKKDILTIMRTNEDIYMYLYKVPKLMTTTCWKEDTSLIRMLSLAVVSFKEFPLYDIEEAMRWLTVIFSSWSSFSGSITVLCSWNDVRQTILPLLLLLLINMYMYVHTR